jgi:hypothetical protein
MATPRRSEHRIRRSSDSTLEQLRECYDHPQTLIQRQIGLRLGTDSQLDTSIDDGRLAILKTTTEHVLQIQDQGKRIPLLDSRLSSQDDAISEILRGKNKLEDVVYSSVGFVDLDSKNVIAYDKDSMEFTHESDPLFHR